MFELSRKSEISTAGILIWMSIILFLSISVAGACWGSGYLSPLFIERTRIGILNGDVRYGNPDTFFHSAVAHMIQTFGKPSTGLDGAPFLPYHIGSHWILAMWSQLTGIGILKFYQLGYVVIFAPLFIKSIFSVVIKLTPKPVNLLSSLGVFTVLVFFSSSDNIVSYTSINNVFLSESFLISLCLLMYLVQFILSIQYPSKKIENKKWRSLFEATCQGMTIISFLGLISITKLSVGYVALALLLFLLARSRVRWTVSGFIVAILSAVVCWKVKSTFTIFDSSASAFLPWALHKEGSPGHPVMFYFFHFAPIYCYIYLKNCRRARSLRNLDPISEVLMVSIIVALLPALTIRMYGNWQYFTQVPYWLSVPFLIAAVSSPSFDIQRIADHFRYFKIVFIGVVCALAFVGISSFSGAYFRGLVSDHDHLKIAAHHPEQASNRLIIDALINIDESVSLQNKRHSLLYIPKSNRYFWGAFPLCEGNWWVPAVGFMGPSITGMAMLDGLPEQDCVPYAYGFNFYKHSKSRLNVNLNERDACERAQSLGFSKIVILRSEDVPLKSFQSVACNP
jgi:hypothetical protein